MEALKLKYNTLLKTNDSEDLIVETNKVLNELNKFIIKNELRKSGGDIPSFLGDLELEINNLPINQRKKLKRFINEFRTKGSIKSANKLLWYLFTKVIKGENKVVLKMPLEHFLIQEKRKLYLKALESLKQAKNEYKLQKGEFYKNRINKRQII